MLSVACSTVRAMTTTEPSAMLFDLPGPELAPLLPRTAGGGWYVRQPGTHPPTGRPECRNVHRLATASVKRNPNRDLEAGEAASAT